MGNLSTTWFPTSRKRRGNTHCRAEKCFSFRQRDPWQVRSRVFSPRFSDLILPLLTWRFNHQPWQLSSPNFKLIAGRWWSPVREASPRYFHVGPWMWRQWFGWSFGTKLKPKIQAMYINYLSCLLCCSCNIFNHHVVIIIVWWCCSYPNLISSLLVFSHMSLHLPGLGEFLKLGPLDDPIKLRSALYKFLNCQCGSSRRSKGQWQTLPPSVQSPMQKMTAQHLVVCFGDMFFLIAPVEQIQMGRMAKMMGIHIDIPV